MRILIDILRLIIDVLSWVLRRRSTGKVEHEITEATFETPEKDPNRPIDPDDVFDIKDWNRGK